MFACLHCHFETLLDDVQIPLSGRHCVCLGCYLRLVDEQVRLTKAFMRELNAVLNAIA